MADQFANVAFYRFFSLDGTEAAKALLLESGLNLGLKGSVLLAPEGINAMASGPKDAIEEWLSAVRSIDADPSPWVIKYSYSAGHSFKRYTVKIKKEIIPFGPGLVDPAARPGNHLPPETLKQWLDEKRDVVLLDTRNGFEVDFGAFENTADFRIRHFRDFPKIAKTFPEEWKNKTVVTYCTGGVRCEKVAPYLRDELGYKDVWQLEGGILNYFAQVGSAHYRDTCFVFDQRITLQSDLSPLPGAKLPAGHV